MSNFFLASGCASPSAETNSVQKISGLPYLAIIRRNTQSVTSAMGAKQKIGFFDSFQKFFILGSYEFTVNFIVETEIEIFKLGIFLLKSGFQGFSAKRSLKISR